MLRYARVTILIAALWVVRALPAQGAAGLDLGGGLVANGEAERYLRVLQLIGVVPQHPVAIRPWTRQELRGLTPTADHPWAARFETADSAPRRARFTLLRPGARLTWNGGRPANDGAVWFGRGATVDVSGGVRFTMGALDVQLAPMAFWAQNEGFALAPNGLTGSGALRDARFPYNIDAPQRFGTGAYARFDAGNSRISIDTRAVTFGFSTAPVAWGPARDEPLTLGPNAGGFPHFYAGSGEPWPVGIGRLHVKLLAGQLDQSRWSPMTSGDPRRLLSGFVATFEPRGVRGLEVGVVRTEDLTWRPGIVSWRNVLRPLTGVLSDPSNHENIAGEDGYASAFFRWAVARAGLEVYGEYGREDFAANTRALVLKPDDLGNLLLGVQRATRADGAVRVLRVELVNAELSANERGQRGFDYPIPPYTHSEVLQGQTVNGLILGSATAYGGAGWRVASDVYSASGRRTVVFERRLLMDWLPVAADPAGRAPEVRYAAGVDCLRFAGPRGEIGVSAELSYTLNVNTVRGHDGVGVQTSVRWRGW